VAEVAAIRANHGLTGLAGQAESPFISTLETCMTSMPRISPLIALVACLFTPLGWAQSQGVGKTEISLGSIQDLSGPLAGFGKQVRLGMLLAVDELNEQGGINGRKLTIKIEDSGYDPKKAFLAAQKLVTKTRFLPWWPTSAQRKTWLPCPCSLKRTW